MCIARNIREHAGRIGQGKRAGIGSTRKRPSLRRASRWTYGAQPRSTEAQGPGLCLPSCSPSSHLRGAALPSVLIINAALLCGASNIWSVVRFKFDHTVRRPRLSCDSHGPGLGFRPSIEPRAHALTALRILTHTHLRGGVRKLTLASTALPLADIA